MSGHYITGKSLPKELIEKLVNSKKANGGEPQPQSRRHGCASESS
jgi:Zn-dependent oligopeptidase